MKTSKAASKKPAEEECGVWLDAAQLKKKAKQVCGWEFIPQTESKHFSNKAEFVFVALLHRTTQMKLSFCIYTLLFSL